MLNINKFSMGITAAIMTSMGLIVGLSHGESGRMNTIAGLLIVAIADNISDSLGIHIYKESEGAERKEIRSFTYGNFFVRLLISLTFVLFVFVLPSRTALFISCAWGLILLTILSYLIAKIKKTSPYIEIVWHLIIALTVIVASKFLGDLISNHVAIGNF